MFGRYALPSDDLLERIQPVVTSSGEQVGYTADNWHDVIPAKPAKLTTTTGWWVFDMLAPVSVAAFALIYHNLDAGFTGITLEWNSSDSWGSPAGALNLVVPTWLDDLWPISPWDVVPDATAYRYWRLSITVPNTTEVTLGRPLFVGTLRDLENDVRWGVIEEGEYRCIEQVTVGGVVTIADPNFSPIRSFSGEFALTDPKASELLALHRSARNRIRPWLLIPDVAVNDAWIVRFQETKYSRTRETINHNIFPFRVDELSRGLLWP